MREELKLIHRRKPIWPGHVLLLALGLTGGMGFANDSKQAVYNSLTTANKLIAQNYCLPCEENKWAQYDPDAKIKALDLYDKNDKTKFTHVVNVDVVVFNGSNWTTNDAHEAYKKAAKVYAQCGIKLNATAIETASPIGLVDINVDPGKLRGHTHSIVSRLPEASDHVIRDFRVRSLHEADLARTSRSVGAGSDTPSLAFANPDMKFGHNPRSKYKNEIWVAYGAKENEKYFPHSYSIIAHELGHILLNCDEQDELDPVPQEFECRPLHDKSLNLMGNSYEYVANILTPEQCQRMKNEERDSNGNKIIRNRIIQKL